MLIARESSILLGTNAGGASCDHKGVDGHKGKLLTGCGQSTSATQFARYIEGKETAAHEPYPYSGTPSGEALAQAYYYFKQDGSNRPSGWPAAINSFSSGTETDPYYAMVYGVPKTAGCRKSYVVLMSDGNWFYNVGGELDPIRPARVMHNSDIRTSTDFPGNQNVGVYTVFAFNASGTDDYNYGSRAQKWTALYGGFRDLSGCNAGWPYPRSNYLNTSSVYQTPNSASTVFNITQCTAATPNACCKEWDLNYDMLTPGDGLGKGIPDNYFEVQSGDQLRDAIQKILNTVEQQNASSSAVATVSQQTGEGDIIIRGMFQAKPPPEDQTNYGIRYYWFGHMESYWPDNDGF